MFYIEKPDKFLIHFFMRLTKLLVSIWGAQKLTGENLKVVWAEFSTLS